MRLTMLGLSLGLALAATMPTARAADWETRGSLKDRGGVPVPAPIPVPETFKWYLRADVGGGLYTGGDASAKGDIYGQDRDPLDGLPFGMSSAWFNNGFDTFAMGGVGIGAYLGPRFRADVTVDARTKSTVDADGTYRYYSDVASNIRVDGNAHERTEVRDTVGLFNLYWDLTERGTRFVPYVGAGVGFAVRTIDRWHTSSEIVTDQTDPLNPTLVTTRGRSGEGKAHQVALAAAAQAGFAYTLNQGMVLDVSYRFAYIGGVDAAMPIGNGSTSNSSRLSLDDMFEHALRAGIRWNIW